MLGGPIPRGAGVSAARLVTGHLASVAGLIACRAPATVLGILALAPWLYGLEGLCDDIQHSRSFRNYAGQKTGLANKDLSGLVGMRGPLFWREARRMKRLDQTRWPFHHILEGRTAAP